MLLKCDQLKEPCSDTLQCNLTCTSQASRRCSLCLTLVNKDICDSKWVALFESHWVTFSVMPCAAETLQLVLFWLHYLWQLLLFPEHQKYNQLITDRTCFVDCCFYRWDQRGSGGRSSDRAERSRFSGRYHHGVSGSFQQVLWAYHRKSPIMLLTVSKTPNSNVIKILWFLLHHFSRSSPSSLSSFHCSL